MTIYLYKKTHNKTGLQYLGKTTRKDPHKYKGSGDRWIPHIKKHGYDVTTEILRECSTDAEVKEWGLYYSELWNVVESKDWANLKPEEGQGFATKNFNPKYDTTVYHWENIKTLEIVRSTQSDFIARYNLEQSHVSMLVAGKCRSCRDWHIHGRRLNDNKGANNYQHDTRIFTWVHVITGETLSMDRYQFAKLNNITSLGNLSRVINKTRNSINNWKVFWE